MGTLVKFGNVYGNFDGMSYAGNVWDSDYYSPALNTAQGGGRQPMIVVKDKGMDKNKNEN